MNKEDWEMYCDKLWLLTTLSTFICDGKSLTEIVWKKYKSTFGFEILDFSYIKAFELETEKRKQFDETNNLRQRCRWETMKQYYTSSFNVK